MCDLPPLRNTTDGGRSTTTRIPNGSRRAGTRAQLLKEASRDEAKRTYSYHGRAPVRFRPAPPKDIERDSPTGGCAVQHSRLRWQCSGTQLRPNRGVDEGATGPRCACVPSERGHHALSLLFPVSKELLVKQTNPIRVLVADDHMMVREGLAALINRRPDMVVVAQACNGRELADLFLLHRPDVALVDLRMPELDGAEAIADIRQHIPAARAIVLTTYDDDEDIQRSFMAGAKAYLLKGVPSEELLACIKTVHEGGDFIPPDIAAKLKLKLSA